MGDQGQLSISTEKHDKGTVLCINGRVDGTNADTLEGVVRDQLEAGQWVLAFDLTNLSYMSSAGFSDVSVKALSLATDHTKHEIVFCSGKAPGLGSDEDEGG